MGLLSFHTFSWLVDVVQQSGERLRVATLDGCLAQLTHSYADNGEIAPMFPPTFSINFTIFD